MNPNRLKFRRVAKPAPVAEESNNDAYNLADLAWGELTKLAREMGVFKVGMKRHEVEASITEAAI